MESPAPQSSPIRNLAKQTYYELNLRYVPALLRPFNWLWTSGLTTIIKRLFATLLLNPYLQTIILLAQALWLILVLLLIAYLPLSAMDQANDAFRAIVNENRVWAFYAHLTSFGFGLTVWFSCRMLFILFDLRQILTRINANSTFDKFTKTQLRQFIKWVPPLLGAMPFLIFLTGLSGAENSGLDILLVLVEMMVYVYIITLNENFISNDNVRPVDEEADRQHDYLSLQEHTFSKLRTRYRIVNYLIAFLIGILFVAFSWYDVSIYLSRSIGVIAVFFTAMSVWVFLAYSLMRLDYTYKVPIAIVVLSIITFFWNTNNHQIQTCSEGYSTKQQAGNLDIGQHFARWIEARHDSITAWGLNKKHENPRYPVYIIASEGGGLRAGYWTASVLGQLSREIPHFYERTYALSTVSGGSVGAAVYTKLYRDSLGAVGSPDWAGQTVYNRATAILEKDYLSPLVGAFLLPDMAQKLLPVGIRAVDRARYLENALSDEYKKVVRKDSLRESPLDTPFMHIWSGKDKQNRSLWYQVPALFMNCTRVEDGQKAILSNLEIKGEAFQGVNNQNVIDLQERIHKHIPIKTAAFMSARFPIVTPPATVQANTTKREDMMTIVDGGYIDNSGLETALAVLTTIRRNTVGAIDQLVSNKRLTSGKKGTLVKDLATIELHLILIKSSEQSDEERVPNRGLYEIRGPLTAFFNSWDINIGSKLNVAREYLRLAANQGPIHTTIACVTDTVVDIKVDKELVMLDLNRKQQVIPLGWFLSDTARHCINRQAGLIKYRFATSIKRNLRHELP